VPGKSKNPRQVRPDAKKKCVDPGECGPNSHSGEAEQSL